MEIAKIRGEARQPGNRHANERLRRRGLIPAVIYGHGQAPETVAVSQHDLELVLGRAHVVQLDMAAGAGKQYLIKDVQYDHLQKDLVHVDLMRVDVHERVEVKVPVSLKGEAKGIHEGGELVQLITDLEVECPLLSIPELITHNVKELGVDDNLYVRDLTLPPDVKALHEPDEIVAVVRMKKAEEVAPAAAAAEGAEAAAEPEVIKRAKEEEAPGEEKK
ncbi:MAG: 50S ribosomal protein L25 [Phycisphaerae bacterium]|jgi:large subunit ribosomal protein L25|nr:50S ribosomal protein L25 [Phycisphaerae bacterium]HOO17486.1 50S ribosomal protein L25 [Phycisphaerae bacterium]HPC22951.1 50S ribosomal protein L25 [Phycisphaerae bacterium]HRS29041.1 50S ribosomal protein L25 [Phycisphaerae bacterium]HRT43400.1 50S ribosomal protein L25 [Phycisphaerae bacterium]